MVDTRKIIEWDLFKSLSKQEMAIPGFSSLLTVKKFHLTLKAFILVNPDITTLSTLTIRQVGSFIEIEPEWIYLKTITDSTINDITHFFFKWEVNT